jgi:hypothetical protein
MQLTIGCVQKRVRFHLGAVASRPLKQQLCNFMMKKITLCIGFLTAIALTIYFSFPPYALPAYTFWVMHGQALEEMDKEFAASGKKEWDQGSFNLKPIFVSEQGNRVYFMGSLGRFGSQYDIAFLKGEKALASCGFFKFYFAQEHECKINLKNGWVIYYVIHPEYVT